MNDLVSPARLIDRVWAVRLEQQVEARLMLEFLFRFYSILKAGEQHGQIFILDKWLCSYVEDGLSLEK